MSSEGSGPCAAPMPIMEVMAAVVIEDAFPVRYETWADWRRARLREPVTLVEAGTVFCGTCWGQRRTWQPARNGEGLLPRICPTCLGRGHVPTAPAT